MPDLCVNCGNELRAGAKFCLKCGTKQPEGVMGQPQGTTVCVNCGNTLRPGAKFCLQCGTKQPDETKQPLTRSPELTGQSAAMQQGTAPHMQPVQIAAPSAPHMQPVQPTQMPPQPTVQAARQMTPPPGPAMQIPPAMGQNPAMMRNPAAGAQTAFSQLSGLLNASAMPGEVMLGEFGNNAAGAMNGMQGAMNMARGASGVMRGAAGAVRGMSRAENRKDAVKAFVSAGILALVWIVQIVLARKGIDNPVTKIGNFLTFGKGGLNRNIIGLAGGILGKGVVATALVSVVCNAKSIGTGFSRMFSGKRANTGGAYPNGPYGMQGGPSADTGNIGLAILGGAVAILLYWFFTGNMKISGMMAALSGAVIAASSLGSRGGVIYRGLSAITSKTVNGRKVPSNGNIKSLLTGVSVGFGIAAAMSAVISVIGLIAS